MEELNKKLGIWAGFKVEVVRGSFEFWEAPDGKKHLPDFTNSLDACFKWLVPKLQENYSIDGVSLFVRWVAQRESLLQKNFIPNGWEVEIWFRDRKDIEGIWAETPALALCKAVEKVIDG